MVPLFNLRRRASSDTPRPSPGSARCCSRSSTAIAASSPGTRFIPGRPPCSLRRTLFSPGNARAGLLGRAMSRSNQIPPPFTSEPVNQSRCRGGPRLCRGAPRAGGLGGGPEPPPRHSGGGGGPRRPLRGPRACAIVLAFRREGAMAKTRIEGSFVALITPFNADGSVDLGAFRTLLRFQEDHGTAAVLFLGSTGEPTLLSAAERQQIVVETAGMKTGRMRF